MATPSVERKVSEVIGDMETNEDSMRILCDMGLDICSTWHAYDTAEDNGRMNEQMFVLFHTLQANLKTYKALMLEGLTAAWAKE